MPPTTGSTPGGGWSQRLSSDAFRSAATKSIVLVEQAAIGLLVTRLVFDHGHVAAYAAAALFASVLGLLPFADLGTGASVANAMAGGSDTVDAGLVRRTVLTAARTLLVSGCLVVLVAPALFFEPVRRTLLGDSATGLPGLGLGAVLALVLFGIAIPTGLGQRLLLAAGRNHFAVRAQAVGPVVSLGWVAAVILLDLPVGLLVATASAAMLAMGGTALAMARRQVPGYAQVSLRDVLDVRGAPGVSIRREALPMVVITTATALSFQTDRLVLSHVTSSGALAEYSLAAQLQTPLWAVIATAGVTLWPVFAGARSRGERPTSVYRQAMLAFGLIGLGGALGLAALGAWAGTILSGGRVELHLPLLLGFGVLLVIQSLHLVSGMFATDTAGLRFQAYCAVGMLATNLPLSILLARTWGSDGPVWASAFAVTVWQFVPTLWLALSRLRRPVEPPAAEPSGGPQVRSRQ